MISPEEDFDTWMMVYSASIDTPEDFALFIPDFERLVDSIVGTGKFPEGVNVKLNEFCQRIEKDFIKKVFLLSHMNKGDCKILKRFCLVVIKLGIYGVKIHDYDVLCLIESVIQNTHSSLVATSNSFSLAKICKYTACNNFFEYAFSYIHEGIKDIRVLNKLLFSIIRCSTFYDAYDFWKMSSIVSSCIIELLKGNIRDIPSDVLSNIYSALESNARAQSSQDRLFVDQWLQISSKLIFSEVFQKQLQGFKTVYDLLGKKEFYPSALDWFSEETNSKIFDGTVLHEEFMDLIGNSLRLLCNNDFCPFSAIKSLWSLHSVQHSTEIPKFYKIFALVSSTIGKGYIDPFLELILSPKERNQQWYGFIGNLGNEVGKRPEFVDSFMKIRGVIWDGAIEKGNEDAYVALSRFIHHHMNTDSLVEILERILNNPITEKTFLLFGESASSVKMPLKYIQIFYRAGTDLIVTHQISSPQSIYGFLYSVSFLNDYHIDDEFVEKLFKEYQNDEYVLDFLISLVESELINEDYIEKCILSLSPEFISERVSSFFRDFYSKINKYKASITHLPMIKEDLLWHLCSFSSPSHQDFCKFICKVYSSNDPSLLDDYKMINTFLLKWNQVFNQTKEKECLLILLKEFIYTIENAIDISFYNIKRHSMDFDKDIIDVEISGSLIPSVLKHRLPLSMTINALKDRIQRFTRIPSNMFKVKKNGHEYPGDTVLSVLAFGEKSLLLSIVPLDSKDGITPRVLRATIPSVLLSQSPILHIIVDYLKEGLLEAKKILDYLPSDKNAQFKVHQIMKRSTFNYSELLPDQYPLLYIYCFEVLENLFSNEMVIPFEATGGFKFLFDTIKNDVKGIMSKKIINFLKVWLPEDLKLSYSQHAFDSVLPLMTNLTMPETKEMYTLCISFLSEIADKPGFAINISSSFQFYIRVFLLSNMIHVRAFFESLVSKIPEINQDYFVASIEHSPLNEQFLSTMAKFISKNDPKLNEKILYLIFTEDSEFLPYLLRILEKLISLGYLNDQLDSIEKKLIDMFLRKESPSTSKEAFISAAQCFSAIKSYSLYKHIESLHDSHQQFKEWRVPGDTSRVSKTGYVGLLNLGATCFLDSILQQFYMIPILRNRIISYSGDDEFMIELSRLFSKLSLSRRHAVTTEGLVKKWMGWDGEPMNPRVQQDACEFAQMLIDKLEKGLGVEFVSSLFKGKSTFIIEGINESYQSESNEQWLTFNLSVKDTNSMSDSFSKFMLPDYFTGANQYKAESLQKKIDAKKYGRISLLPKYLIIQLGRFEYDYQTWQRQKINSLFYIPLSIDLKDYTIHVESCTKYHLRGIVMHYGSAQCGHYVSFVKERNSSNRWVCFNDSVVKEIKESDVMNAAIGKSDGNSGYLLFYDMEGLNDEYNDTKPEIPHFICDEIDKDNRLNDEYLLFCSNGYFEMMREFSSMFDHNYIALSYRYFFDSLLYTSFTKSAYEIANPLMLKIKESKELASSLLSLNINWENAIVRCPDDIYRTKTKEIIMSFDPFLIPSEKIKSLFEVTHNLIEFYQSSSQLFEVIKWIITNRPDTHEHAIQILFPEIIKYLCVSAPKYLSEHSKIRPEYFYSSHNFTPIFESFSLLELSQDFIDLMITHDFFKQVIASYTSASSISSLLKKYPNQQLMYSTLHGFVEKNFVHLNYFRVCSVLFWYFEKQSFSIIRKIPFLVEGKSVSSFDFIHLIINFMAITQQTSLFINNLDQWFFECITDDNIDVRLSVMHAVSLIVPHQSFSNLLALPKHSLFKSNPDSLLKAVKEDDITMVQNANSLLEFLINNIDQLIKKISQKSQTSSSILSFNTYIGIQFIELIGYMARITHANVSPLSKIIHSLCGSTQIFDLHIKHALNVCVNNGVQIDQNVLISLLPFPETIHMGLFSRIVEFIELIMPSFSDELFTIDFIKGFIRLYAFPTKQFATYRFEVIAKQIIRMCRANPTAVIDILDSTDFLILASLNFSSLLIFLKALQIKRSVLKYLPTSISSRQFLSNDDIIEYSFMIDDGSEQPDYLKLAIILNIPNISEKSRVLIWEYLTEKHQPQITDFLAQYQKNNDWALLTRFCLATDPNFAKDTILEAATESLEALSISFDWLSNNAQKEICSDSFIQQVLRDGVKSNEDVVIKLLENALKSRTSQEESDYTMKPILDYVEFHATYLNEIFSDLKSGISPDEISVLFGPLNVIRHIQIGTNRIIQTLIKLRYLIDLPEVQQKANIPEIKTLSKILRGVILV